MESIQIQERNPTMVRGARRQKGAGSLSGDGFADVFAQLAMLMQAQTNESLSKSDLELMSQQAAGMALFDPSLLQLLTPEDLSAMLQNSSGPSGQEMDGIQGILTGTGQQAQLQAQGASPEAIPAQAAPVQAQQLMQAALHASPQAATSQGTPESPPNLGLPQAQTQGENADSVPGASLEQLPSLSVSQEDGEGQLRQAFQFESGFRRSVQQAQKLLQEKDTASSGQAVSVEELQNHANAARTQNTAAVQTQRPEAENVANQIQQGVQDNLAQGKKEFVIKLKPEGLGEITVKLSEEPGKPAVLSLAVSHSETAKMINEGITNLQNALKPLHVEVREAVAQTLPSQEQNNNGGSQGFHQPNLFGQAFSGRQEQNNGFRQEGGYQYGAPGLFGEETAEAAAPQVLDASALDTYI